MSDTTRPTQPGNGRERSSFVIIRAGDAFRVYSPGHPADVHIIRTNGTPSCTCRDYNAPGRDKRVPCIHIGAVLAAQNGRFAPQPGAAIPPSTRVPVENAPERGEQVSFEDTSKHMLLKRSVSPDGRIDSLSIEFSLPVAKLSSSDIKASADKAIALQSEIVESFLGRKGEANAPVPEKTPREEPPDGTLYAEIKGVRAMDTKWGRRLYLAFFVNGEHLRLFGSPRRLGEILAFAGFSEYSRQIAEGLELHLPCRVIVEPSPDGRFMNVRRVFPAKD